MAKAKKYVDGSAKEHIFDDGNGVINVWINLDSAKEKGLISKTKSGKNGLAFTIAKRSDVSEYGDTHYMYVVDQGSIATKSAPVKTFPSKPSPPKSEDRSDDLPF